MFILIFSLNYISKSFIGKCPISQFKNYGQRASCHNPLPAVIALNAIIQIFSNHLSQLKYGNLRSEKRESTIIAPSSTTIKTKTTTQNKTPLGSRSMVTGVQSIPRTTKLTSTDAQQGQNRNREDSQTHSEHRNKKKLRMETISGYFRM